MAQTLITDKNLATSGTMPAWDGSALLNLPVSGGTRGTIGGLTTSNGTDSEHDIDIAVGFARDYTDTVTMELSSVLTKQIDSTWSVGDDAGGLDTGAVAASTGYGVYLIRRSDTGVVDALFSTDMSSAGSSVTMPTNYDQKRLIGWVRTDSSSNILGFVQSGDSFMLTGDIVQELSDNTITNDTFETATVTVPPDSLFLGYLTCFGTAGVAMRATVARTGNPDHGGSGTESTAGFNTSGSEAVRIYSAIEVLVNGSSQLDYMGYEASGTTTVTIKLRGCKLLTRSNP